MVIPVNLAKRYWRISLGLDIVDEKGKLIYLNNFLKKRVGSDALGKTCWEVFKDDMKQCPKCSLYEGI